MHFRVNICIDDDNDNDDKDDEDNYDNDYNDYDGNDGYDSNDDNDGDGNASFNIQTTLSRLCLTSCCRM